MLCNASLHSTNCSSISLGNSPHLFAVVPASAIRRALALQMIRLTSNFEDAKKQYGTTKKHWTNVIDKVIAKALNKQ